MNAESTHEQNKMGVKKTGFSTSLPLFELISKYEIGYAVYLISVSTH